MRREQESGCEGGVPVVRRIRWVAVGLVLAVALLYGQVVQHGFIDFDDGYYVTSNDHVQRGLSWETLRWAFTTRFAANWHPLTWLSHTLDWQLFGARPGGHHLTSVFFHVANVLLLFLFLRESTGNLWRSAMVAALFAVHPVHVESVAWVSERKDVLSTFFWLLACIAYLRYARRPGTGRYLLVLGVFGVGLMVKPMLVTLPFVLLLLDYWPLGRIGCAAVTLGDGAHQCGAVRVSQRVAVLEKIPLLFLSLASSVMTVIAQSGSGAVSSLVLLPLGTRVMNSLISYMKYLGKLVWPTDLCIFYPYAWNELQAWSAAMAGGLLLALSVGAIWRVRRQPAITVGWFWFLGTLVPVIGLVQVGGQAVADRYMYIPAIGLYMAVVWPIGSFLGRFSRGALYSGLMTGGVLTALASLTWVHVGTFADSETVFRQALAATDGNYVAHNSLGNVFTAKARYEEAAVHYAKALEIYPEYAEAQANIGAGLAREGRYEQAVEAFERALEMDLYCAPAHLGLARVLGKIGRPEQASRHILTAEGRMLDNSWDHNQLGAVWSEVGHLEGALAHFRRALELSSARAETHNNLGRVLALTGDLEGSLLHLEKAVEIRPVFPEALNNLGLTFLQSGWVEGALYAFGSALFHQPDYGKARQNFQHALGLLPQKKSPAAGPNPGQGSGKGIVD